MLGFGWAYTWRDVCVRFWVGPIHGGKFVLGFQWTYCMEGSLRLVLSGPMHGGKFVLGFGWGLTWREVCVRFSVDLCMEGSLR